MAISTDSALPENRVTISEDLRSMNVPTGEQVLGCVGDAWVRRVWFDMPRYCDGTDLSGYTLSVNYRNTDEDEDRYPVNDAVVNADTITFSWLVGAVACAAPGLTSVSIKAQKLNGDTIEHEFNSTIYYFKVLPANTTGAEPLQEYSDAFTTLMLQWQAEVDEAVAEAPKGKLVGTASGTTAQTVNDAWPTTPESATLYGKSVQNGTPTPDNPVEVQVVSGRNLLQSDAQTKTISGVTFTKNSDGSITANGTATAGITYDYHTLVSAGFLTIPAGSYVLSGCPSGGSGSTYKLDIETTAGSYATDYGTGFAFTISSSHTYRRARIVIYNGQTVNNLTFKPQLEAGNQATPYTPYGCIGLQIGETVTPIDLQGHTLAGLPDGTRDELDIDAAGVKAIGQRVGVVDLGTLNYTRSSSGLFQTTSLQSVIGKPASSFDIAGIMSDSYRVVTSHDINGVTSPNGDMAESSNGTVYFQNTAYTDTTAFKTAMSGVLLYYELATPVTHSLGTMELPELTQTCELAMYASLDPEWAIEYEQDPNAVITTLQSSIAPVEGSMASTNYAVNSYLIHANQLYRVTSAIATGEAITPGSNCTACTVMGEVIRLTA